VAVYGRALVTALPCYGALEIVVFDWLIERGTKTVNLGFQENSPAVRIAVITCMDWCYWDIGAINYCDMLTRPRRYTSDREQPSTSCRRRTGHLLSVRVLRSILQTSCATLAFCSILNWRRRSILPRTQQYSALLMLLPYSPTPTDPPPRRQRRYHPPCVGFDNAAVGLLQLGVRGPTAVDTWAVTEGAERRCAACLWLTSSWQCLGISDATTLHSTLAICVKI